MSNSSLRIPVALKHQPYEVVIAACGLSGIGKELYEMGIKPGVKILVVSNSDVANPYGEVVLKSLQKIGFKSELLIIEAGEDKKNLESVSLIHDAAYEAKLERSSLMIALGGGVIGDMTGFAAATWLRGISYIQIPTTLLAMVDASVGGKTGVNHSKGKNLIGAFHQPKLVFIDTSTLQTLPDREFRAGMAEIIKYGVIEDCYLFEQLEKMNTINKLSDFNSKTLKEIIKRSIYAKATIVKSDEKESGIRAILNYGHTFGHVVEALCGYGKWLHGEAVSIGMIAVGELALSRKSWSKDDANRQKALLIKAGLPTKWPELNLKDVFRSLKGDKKVQDGNIRFVLPTKIGAVEIRNDISDKEIGVCLTSIE